MYKDSPLIKEFPIVLQDCKFYVERLLANVYGSSLYLMAFSADIKLKNNILELKNISSADDLPVEKKHFDTISIPAENVPRMFLIGNNFSKKLYEESDSEGVNRRILIVIPTMPIQDLGYQWKELIQPSCQQWVVQSAIEEYKAQNLHKIAIPIGYENISDAEKDNGFCRMSFYGCKSDYNKRGYEPLRI